jgi:GDPmannose 4,6-dehydratase
MVRPDRASRAGQRFRPAADSGCRAMSRRALVTGGAGQDGWYLTRLLLEHGYEVHAHARREAGGDKADGIRWHFGDIGEAAEVARLLGAVRPDEIYNLASFSRPRDAIEQPVASSVVNALGPLHIFDFARCHLPGCRIFQPSSSEIFGAADAPFQDETTACRPASPYGIAKLFAHEMAAFYRRRFGLFVSCGILFNHESPRRPLQYVSQKIAHAAAAVGLGIVTTVEIDEVGRPIVNDGRLRLGNLDVRRDFGFAGDYAEAMWLALQADTADDYVIGTGQSYSIRDFCEMAFAHVGKDWRAHVEVDPALLRPIDSLVTVARPAKAAQMLGWRPRTPFKTLVAMLVDARVAALREAGTA